MEKTKYLWVLSTLAKNNFAIMSFDLWLLEGTHDMFAFLISFLGANWQLKDVTLGLFEVVNISWKTLAKYLIKLLEKYNEKKMRDLM